jgi:transcription initiation factor IIE alpha subunit
MDQTIRCPICDKQLHDSEKNEIFNEKEKKLIEEIE